MIFEDFKQAEIRNASTCYVRSKWEKKKIRTSKRRRGNEDQTKEGEGNSNTISGF